MNASTLDMLPMKPAVVAKDKDAVGDAEKGMEPGLIGSGVPFAQVLDRQLGSGKAAIPEGVPPTTSSIPGQAAVPTPTPGAAQDGGSGTPTPTPGAAQGGSSGTPTPSPVPPALPGASAAPAPEGQKNVAGLRTEFTAGEPDLPQAGGEKAPAMTADYAAEARARLAAQWRDGAPAGGKAEDGAAAAGKPGPADPADPSLGLRPAELGSLAAGLRLESMSLPVPATPGGEGSGGQGAAGVETADVGRQVAEALARHVGPTARGGALRLTLNPEHLGKVEMEFRRAGDTLRVTLHAETAAAAAALEDGADELVETLLGRAGAWQHVAVRVTCRETDDAEGEGARGEDGRPSDRRDGDGDEGARDEYRDAEEGARR